MTQQPNKSNKADAPAEVREVQAQISERYAIHIVTSNPTWWGTIPPAHAIRDIKAIILSAVLETTQPLVSALTEAEPYLSTLNSEVFAQPQQLEIAREVQSLLKAHGVAPFGETKLTSAQEAQQS